MLKPAVLDTNIYYRKPSNVRSKVEEHNLAVSLTPNNILEVITPNLGKPDQDMSKRRGAAATMLELNFPLIQDSESTHAKLLGFMPGELGDWIEALKRFEKLEELTASAFSNLRIDIPFAVKSIEEPYKAFTDKISNCQIFLNDVWKQNRSMFKDNEISFELFYERNTIAHFLKTNGIPAQVAKTQVERTTNLATQFGLKGSLIAEPDRTKAVSVYCTAYCLYLEYALSTQKRDPNDFGDLQFFAFCDDGYVFVTGEQRWQQIVQGRGLDEHLIYWPQFVGDAQKRS